MTNSFLILFITIKAEIALILQYMNINMHSVIRKKGTEKKKFSTLLYFFPITTPTYTPQHIEGGRKKEKKILYTLSFSLYHPHRHLSHLSLLENQTHKYWKRKKKKEKRKGEEILKLFSSFFIVYRAARVA